MNTHFSAKGIELTSELEKYATRRLMRAARRVPRKLRASAECRVELSRSGRRTTKDNTCSIVLAIDGAEFSARETTQHMHATLDVAAAHIEQQVRQYAQQQGGLLRRHLRAS